MESVGQSNPSEGPSLLFDVKRQLQRRYQHLLDKTAIFPGTRWASLAALLVLYILRVRALAGWYIVTYGLGIYVLNLFIGFLTPKFDPETEGPVLPTKGSDEFKPFIGKLPEFKFWQATVKAILVAFTMTFFSLFDVPVFWPILLLYFIVLLTLTMKNQIAHMIKYRYLPFSWGKAKYTGKGKKSMVEKPSIASATEPRFSGSNIK